MIRFTCKCGNKIKVDEIYAGKKGKCPKCGKMISIPKKSSDNHINVVCQMCGKTLYVSQSRRGKLTECPDCKCYVEVPLNKTSITSFEHEKKESYQVTQSMKKCPFCGEDILGDAIKCKHCGEFLTNVVNPNHVFDNSHTLSQSIDGSNKQTDIFAILCFATGMLSLLMMPIIFVPICYIMSFISRYRLKENSYLKGKLLLWIGSISGLVSMIWVLYLFGFWD